MATFYVPAVNLIGKGVVNEVGPYIKELGYKKALLVVATTATMRTTANEKGTTGAFAIYNISRVVLEIVHGFTLKVRLIFWLKANLLDFLISIWFDLSPCTSFTCYN